MVKKTIQDEFVRCSWCGEEIDRYEEYIATTLAREKWDGKSVTIVDSVYLSTFHEKCWCKMKRVIKKR